MSTGSLNQDSQFSFSEPFLNYLNTGINNAPKTYCEDNTSKYHDSRYVWCRLCDKIFCDQCSMNHLINNQINHCPSENVFLRKEHLDIEFNRDFEKANLLRKKIIYLFRSDGSEISPDKINSLKEILNNFQSLANDLFNNIIPKFIKKYNESIENLKSSMKEVKTYSLNKDNVKIRSQEIYRRFEKIGEDYTKNQKFQPKMFKPYYEELMNSFRDFQSLNELIDKNCNNNNADNPDINKEYNNINSNLTQAINIINSFKKDLICHINN